MNMPIVADAAGQWADVDHGEQEPSVLAGLGVLVAQRLSPPEPLFESRPMKHTRYVCTCHETGCQFCDGGLFACTICGAFEGAITQHCPGVRVDMATWDKVYCGELDYVDGQWIPGNGSMPCHTHKIEVER